MRSIYLLTELVPAHIIDRTTGKLLGDGNISIEQKRKPRFRFSHCLQDRGWAEHCYNELKEHIKLSSPKKRKIIDKRIIQGYTEYLYVQSLTSPVTLAWWY